MVADSRRKRNPLNSEEMAGFHIENFGCRAARADGDAISSGLLAAGQHRAQPLSQADVVVVNR